MSDNEHISVKNRLLSLFIVIFVKIDKGKSFLKVFTEFSVSFNYCSTRKTRDFWREFIYFGRHLGFLLMTHNSPNT